MIPYRLFSSLTQTFTAPTRNVFIAYKNKQPLCSCLVLQQNGICHLELTGEYPAARNYGAMQLLMWKVLLNARKDGCQKFSFGRTNLDSHGLLQFKRRWNAEEEDLSVFKWKPKSGNAERPITSMVEPILKQANGILPRPLYQGLGSFIYNHWG